MVIKWVILSQWMHRIIHLTATILLQLRQTQHLVTLKHIQALLQVCQQQALQVMLILRMKRSQLRMVLIRLILYMTRPGAYLIKYLSIIIMMLTVLVTSLGEALVMQD